MQISHDSLHSEYCLKYCFQSVDLPPVVVPSFKLE
jgi:hypothetical protein